MKNPESSKDSVDLKEPKPDQARKAIDTAGFSQRMEVCASIAGNANLLAAKTGISRRAIGNYLSGDSDPSRERLIAIARATDTSVLWLATGEGPMLTSTSQPDTEKERTYIKVQSGAIGSTPLESGDFAFRYEWLRTKDLIPENLRLLPASSNAMSPTILEGDIQLVDTATEQLLDGHIYIFDISGQQITRRVQTLWDGGVTLHADNPEYENQVIEQQNVNQLEISGRVVWNGRLL